MCGRNGKKEKTKNENLFIFHQNKTQKTSGKVEKKKKKREETEKKMDGRHVLLGFLSSCKIHTHTREREKKERCMCPATVATAMPNSGWGGMMCCRDGHLLA